MKFGNARGSLRVCHGHFLFYGLFKIKSRRKFWNLMSGDFYGQSGLRISADTGFSLGY